jgi:hypothetical protein
MEILFDEYSARVRKHLESFYGIRVVTRDIPDRLIGDLDGSEIHIDHAVTPEQRLFKMGLLSRICGLIPVQEDAPTCNKGLFASYDGDFGLGNDRKVAGSPVM